MHHSDPDVIVVWKLAGHLDPLQNILDLVTAEIDAIPIEFRGAALDVVSSSVQHIQIADAMVVQVTNHRVVEYVSISALECDHAFQFLQLLLLSRRIKIILEIAVPVSKQTCFLSAITP